MDGACHCGEVRISVASAPSQVLDCRCSICRRYGALWAYYPLNEVTMTGPTDVYVWGDGMLQFHRCVRCGCMVAWMPSDDDPTRCGINARMLDGFDLETPRRISQGPV